MLILKFQYHDQSLPNNFYYLQPIEHLDALSMHPLLMSLNFLLFDFKGLA